MKQDVNRKVWWGLALAVAWSLSGTLVACAQEPEAGEPAAQTAKQETRTPEPKPIRGRLPDHYGKLGISQEQRTQIYEIQADYRAKMTALQEQIAKLEMQEVQDVEEVLTDEQLEELREHQREAAARRAARRRPAPSDPPENAASSAPSSSGTDE